MWILQKHRIFLSLYYFSKNLAMFCFVLLSRLQANHCWMYKKMTMFKKNTNTLNYPISIRYLQSEKNRVPEESDSSRCLDFYHKACLEIPQPIFLCRQATWVLFFEGRSWNVNCNHRINNKNTGRKHLTKSHTKKIHINYTFWIYFITAHYLEW